MPTPGVSPPVTAATAAVTTWRELLDVARLAPSPHNVQPWRLRVVDDTHAEIAIERGRTLPKEDVEGSFLVLTMGIFLEAVGIAAAARGLALSFTIARPLEEYSTAGLARIAGDPIVFARLALDRGPTVDDGAMDLLRRRRTSRLPYRREPLVPEDGATLATLATAHGHRAVFVDDANVVERVIDMNVAAIFEDLNHPPYRDELRGWLRYSDAGARRTRDGLSARCMHQSAVELWTAFHAGWLLRAPLTHGWLARRYREQTGPVTTVGLLAGPFWPPSDAFTTGGFLLRFWLECTRLGWFLHPWGNLVTNRAWAARLEALTGVPGVWLVFRIGRSDPPPASERRTVEEILL